MTNVIILMMTQTGIKMTRTGKKILCYFCIVCVLMTTGCISQGGPGNQTIVPRTPESTPVIITSGTPSPSTKETPVIIGPLGTPCPPTNETPYIIINPVRNFTLGGMLEVNGTTNIGQNKNIQYHVYSPVRVPPLGVQYESTDISGDILITNQDCKIQNWSFVLETNNFTTSDLFFIGVWTGNWTSPNRVYNDTILRIYQGEGMSWGEIK